MAAKDELVTKKETSKLKWKIEKFSELKQDILYSDTFLSGGQKWKISVFPKGNGVDAVSVYLWVADSENMRQGWSVLADFSLTVVNNLKASSSVKYGAEHDFKKGDSSWGWKRFVLLVDLYDDQKGYLVNDTLNIEAQVSTEVAAAAGSEANANDEPKVIEAHDQPHVAAIKVSLSEPVSQTSQVEVDGPFSPSTVQLTSRDLIAPVPSMTSSGHDNHGTSNSEHGSELLQQQWEKLDGFLGRSLEAISQAKSLDEVENIAIQIAEHATDPIEKTVLRDVVTRLAEFKEIIPTSLSTIETSHAAESSAAEMSKDVEVRLVHRKRQLSSLEAELSRLGEEEMKLESEIKKLTGRKATIVDHRNSTVVELEKANQLASKELNELKKHRGESKQAVENRMRAMERLAQCNASWKLFKTNLRR